MVVPEHRQVAPTGVVDELGVGEGRATTRPDGATSRPPVFRLSYRRELAIVVASPPILTAAPRSAWLPFSEDLVIHNRLVVDVYRAALGSDARPWR